ncbi:hypothetical protein ACLOJK_024725 [Asimina triloba]
MASLKVPRQLPTPAEDAENLRKACLGWGTDEKAIISILGHRDSDQRELIRLAYEELYQEDLYKLLESETSGVFKNAVYLWILDPADRDAVLARTALKKVIPDIRVIIEIACVKTPLELLAVKRAYHARYNRSLEEDLLVALVGQYRYNGVESDKSLALAEAKILHDNIQGKEFIHEEILRILSTRSVAQLNATFNSYKEVYGSSITKHFLGYVGDPMDEYLSALRTTVRCIRAPHKYFQKVLRNAIKGLGTDEDTLTRIIITHAEKDLKEIMELYHKRNNGSLKDAVANDTSGEYKDFLLTLLGEYKEF